MKRVGLAFAAALVATFVAFYVYAAGQPFPFHKGNMQAVPLTQAGLSTTGSVSLSVNPTTGNDTSCSPCATVAGAIATLPPYIMNPVTITIADGAYTVVGATFFGDYTRFNYGPSGSIKITSTSEFARAPTTTTYALAAGAAQGFTLSADPGFAANLYRGYYVRVATGTGAGSTAVIRSNATVNWTIAGTWSGTTPNNTSTIEILDNAAVLTLSDAAATTIVFQGNQWKPGSDITTGANTEATTQLIIDGVGITGTNQVTFDFNGLGVGLVSRFIKIRSIINGGRIAAGLWSSDGQAASATGILSRGGSVRLGNYGVGAGTVYTSVYLRDFTNRGIALTIFDDWVLGIPSSGTLFNTAIDNCTNAAVVVNGSTVDTSSRLDGTGNSTFGMQILNGGRVVVGATSAFSTTTITGTTGDTQLDGVTTSWAEISGANGSYVVGNKDSSVGTNSGVNVGAFREKLLSTTTGVNWNVGTKSTLYTVPTGKTAIFTRVVVRSPSVNMTTASCGFGRDAGAADYSATSLRTGLAAANNYVEIFPLTGAATAAVAGAAGDTFGTLCTILQGAAATVTIDVFGYLL